MKEIKGGVCAAEGFTAGGIRCGIKKGNSQKKDLALIYSLKPCIVSAMFTTNKVQAACIQVSKENISDRKLRAVIVNSGNANACTGDEGLAAAKRMAHLASNVLEVDAKDVAVASTGVIGVPLPIEVIEKNINALKASLRDDETGNADALEAIMTTDTRKKEIAVEIEIDGKAVRIGAMAKGSGMIHPNMATMLCFITTDAAIDAAALEKSLNSAVKHSFNRLTVDGDTSTNDMVLIMANGEAGNKILTESDVDFSTFNKALEYVCIYLTRLMARDGEGATKLVTVTVTGASDDFIAEKLAKSAASSSLVKTACFGADANWGRVLCAMGYAGVDFNAEKTTVNFKSKAGTIKVCQDGKSISFSEEKAKEILSEEEIEICISLEDGRGSAEVWGCDLTYDYVKINGDYRS
ncbi:MAG: bifunctional ornithine acetyltransferase/N-acetylglutamate synthase [Treponema sp.]|nr:bifunctional ornithine acetyltransferase/N-acetylglutamate synthase [Treponema sp.]MCL2251322.1 bifunctional ornithine acetyltransferase/N-acetylglutamate synthase [Treponema sp.]